MSSILVIEADARAGDAAEEFLTCLGHPVRLVLNPGAAVQQIKSCRPYAVLTDLRLPACADPALQSTCDGLAIPLLDLGGAICLTGEKERLSKSRLSEARQEDDREHPTHLAHVREHGVGRR